MKGPTEEEIKLMKTCVEQYKNIDKVGEQLIESCFENIQPLLEEKKFKEAKKYVHNFFKEARTDTVDGILGDVIFIEYNMLIYKINKLEVS